MAKFDVYATIAIQVEAKNGVEAERVALTIPIELWDEENMFIDEVIGHAD